MSRREWPLRFQCGHEGCQETVTYRYSTRRDLEYSFELKHYSGDRWRCVRHTRPNEVLSVSNPSVRTEVVSTAVEGLGKCFFGGHGFHHGLGYKVFADDFPPGTKLIVTAEIVLPGVAS